MTRLKNGAMGAFFIVLSVGAAIVHAAPNPNTAGDTTVTSTDETTVGLTEEHNGGIVAVMVNDKVRVQIEGNPTTGFSWEPENLDAAMLEPVGEPKFTPNNNLRGGNGVFNLTFRALKPGLIPLRLIYHRRFEKNIPPARIFEVTLDIQQ